MRAIWAVSWHWVEASHPPQTSLLKRELGKPSQEPLVEVFRLLGHLKGEHFQWSEGPELGP